VFQGPRCAPAKPAPDGAGLPDGPSPRLAFHTGPIRPWTPPIERPTTKETKPISATATTEKRTGQQKILATYECHEGERQLVGQRVNGTVHISDIPTGEQGRVYLVEHNLITIGELQAIVDDYTAKAAELGHPPMQAWF